ncbi:MAG: oligoendopeptidase F, partial [Erysipelotrichales bacterium]|nr:oligoendopeptidase F [Erysipelotrichales bacterium]
MAEVLKERNEMDPKYQWDLSSLYKNDEEWEKDFAKMDELIAKTASFEGKLKDAKTVREFLDTQNELTGKLENVAGYASLRRSEDTRAQKAQIMWSKAYGKIVQATTALSFAEPEFLSLPEETLTELVKNPLLKEFAFNLEKILRMKPHTLSAAEERLLAGFGEVLGAPGEIASNLMDADLLFDDVQDQNGNTVEVNDSNYILLQSSEDRVLRENSFRSYYKGYKNHINTFAATYAANVKAMTAEA